MPAVSSYKIVLYGGPDGHQTHRAQIQLDDAAGKTVAWVRFSDPGGSFETDYIGGGVIRMHLPSSLMSSVVDLLRNETGLNVHFNAGRAFLGTADEPEEKPVRAAARPART
jgi:hypothetical protein